MLEGSWIVSLRKLDRTAESTPMLLQFSLWNFVHYNVFGGGDSALYGVEGPWFYQRNGLNNLNLIWPLGLAFPLVALLDLFQVTGQLPACLLLRHTLLITS